MEVNEIVRRLEKIAPYGTHYPGEPLFVLSLDDGIALKEAIELLKKQKLQEVNEKLCVALALLREQEPVEPVLDIDTWKCRNCGHDLEHQEMLGDNVLFHEQYNYCPNCGKAVKWDDA